MKGLIFSYINGLNQLYRRSDDADIFVMGIIIVMQGFFILCISALLDFHIPTTEELGNKWVVRPIKAIIFWLFNKYIFGIRESIYSEYTPMPKKLTLTITFIYFAITLGFMIYKSKS